MVLVRARLVDDNPAPGLAARPAGKTQTHGPGVWCVRRHDVDVARAQRGDRDAFARLVDRHARDLYRLAAAMVGEDDAHDVTQDTLVAVWRELPRLRDVDRFPAWMRSIHMNRCRNVLRSRGRRRTVSSGLDPAAFLGLAAQPAEEPIARLHSAWAIDEALSALTVLEREVFALHYVGDLALREVGRTLGIPEGTVKTRLHSGLLRLRRELASPTEAEVVA